MPGKIFVNYRRDDARDMAARIRDRLAATFGDANVFMDVDDLMAGQRFDKELEKALGETDVFLAVIGPRWLDLLAERLGGWVTGEKHDYVREEIAGALRRGIVVIPVLVERTPLPRADALPQDIRELVLHQKHTVTHERFGRDVEDLAEAIRFARRTARATSGGGGSATRWAVAAASAVLLLVGGGLVYRVFAPGGDTEPRPVQGQANKAKTDAVEEARQDEIRKGAEAAANRKEAVAEFVYPPLVKSERALKQSEDEKKRAEAELLRPGRVFRDCAAVCPEMVVLPAGEFVMGSSSGEIAALTKEFGTDWYKNEGPQRKVTIALPFAVGKYEVTFVEWEACAAGGGCTSNPSPFDQDWGRGRRPVVRVSWHDAKEYVAWLSRTTGKAYRLLSESEWEYAARAGTTTRYSFGDAINKGLAHYGASNTVEVGSFPANRFGLHDMHGNAWEWVEDTWSPHYDKAARVLRGGSWHDLPEFLRSAYRVWRHSGDRVDGIGFRVARTL
jgi:formylglycine-generating enzyme required for sulfatase activity